MAFKDYFSEASTNYSIYRPDYPEGLFHYLASLCKEHQRVWDCATGSGQAAKSLARYFDEVIATDASQAQLDSAIKDPKIQYFCAPAEVTPLEPHSVDLVTVAQAVHWFDLEKFYAEARRVLKPEGVLAVWCYQTPEPQDEKVGQLAHKLYWEVTRKYWAKERDYIDNGYEDLLFPFEKIKTPVFYIEKAWSCDEFLGYLGTWSGLRNYLREEEPKTHAVEKIFEEIKSAWPGSAAKITIHWPIVLLVTRF